MSLGNMVFIISRHIIVDILTIVNANLLNSMFLVPQKKQVQLTACWLERVKQGKKVGRASAIQQQFKNREVCVLKIVEQYCRRERCWGESVENWQEDKTQVQEGGRCKEILQLLRREWLGGSICPYLSLLVALSVPTGLIRLVSYEKPLPPSLLHGVSDSSEGSHSFSGNMFYLCPS